MDTLNLPLTVGDLGHRGWPILDSGGSVIAYADTPLVAKELMLHANQVATLSDLCRQQGEALAEAQASAAGLQAQLTGSQNNVAALQAAQADLGQQYDRLKALYDALDVQCDALLAMMDGSDG